MKRTVKFTLVFALACLLGGVALMQMPAATAAAAPK